MPKPRNWYSPIIDIPEKSPRCEVANLVVMTISGIHSSESVEIASAVEIGRRVRACRRRRGLSLRTAADLAGLSPAFLSMVENGERVLDRCSHILALADVLHASPGELVGGPFLLRRPDAAPPVRTASAAVHAAIPALRLAVMGVSLPPAPPDAPPVEALTMQVDEVVQLVDDGDYHRAIGLVPYLLAQLQVAVRKPRTPQREEVLRLLARTYQNACVVPLKNLGYEDLAYIAVERAAAAVAELDDPVDHAMSTFYRAWALRGTSAEKDFLVDTAAVADSFQPHLRTPREFMIYGQLHKRSAYAHAHAGKGADALDHLAEASEAAARARALLGVPILDGPPHGLGSAAMAIDRAKLLYELGHYDASAEAGSQVTLDADVPLAWQATIHAVLGGALVKLGGREREAAAHLVRAERTGPQYMREHPILRQAVANLLERSGHGGMTRDLRDLANRMGAIG